MVWRADSCLYLQKRLNLTKTVRKLPISQDLQRQGHYIHDDRQLDIKYDDMPAVRSVTDSSAAGDDCVQTEDAHHAADY